MTDAAEQHAREIQETWECWQRKPLLRRAYKQFHELIRDNLVPGDGVTVELGSGIGMIKETIPHCITTDLFPSKWVDQQEDAYALTFADGSVQNLILFDVWHHLEFPGSALDEFRRVLRPKGRLILFEPAALSLLGRIVFGPCHHEPIHPSTPLQWKFPGNKRPEQQRYYAAQGNAWKLFVSKRLPSHLQSHWDLVDVNYLSALEWIAAGGFRKRQLCRDMLGNALGKVSPILSRAPKLFATRMLVIMSHKTGTGR